jgi:hypothetical protein
MSHWEEFNRSLDTYIERRVTEYNRMCDGMLQPPSEALKALLSYWQDYSLSDRIVTVNCVRMWFTMGPYELNQEDILTTDGRVKLNNKLIADFEMLFHMTALTVHHVMRMSIKERIESIRTMHAKHTMNLDMMEIAIKNEKRK